MTGKHRFKDPIKADVTYPEDCERIQNILAAKGTSATLIECEYLWNLYSEDLCATWMSMDYYTNEEIFNNINKYLEEVE